MKKNKLTKQQARDVQRKIIKETLKCDGIYLFVNNTKGDLMLPKPTHKGIKSVTRGQTFEGDGYFKCLLKTHDVKLVKVIELAANEKDNSMTEQKLILDQPEQFTNKGKIEHVLPSPIKKLNETPTREENKLLTEDPMVGIEIIHG